MITFEGNKVKIDNVLFGVMNILFIFMFFAWSIMNWSNRDVIYDYNSKLTPWIFGLIFVQMGSFRIKKLPFYDFCLWFVVLSYFFMFGYFFQNFFGLESVLLWNPILNYASDILFHSYVFVILSLELFSFGYLIFYSDYNYLKEYKNVVADERMYQIGIILLSIGGISRLVNDINIIYVVQMANSYLAYSNAVGSGLWDDLACLMLPGIFFIFFSGCIKERSKKIIFLISLAYLLYVMILTGSRKIQIFSILSLLIGYEFSLGKRRTSILRNIVYAFLGIIIVNTVIIIRNYRFDIGLISSVLTEDLLSFSLFSFQNIFGEIFAETGITFLSVASIVQLVPNIMPYQYGLTYLRTIPSFLPIGWLVDDFFNLASSTYVINSYTGIPAGSSFIGDLYWNWGYFGGYIAIFLCGLFVCKFMHINNRIKVRKNYAMYFSFFSQLIILVRSELVDIYRPIIMLVVVVFFLELLKMNFRRLRIKR